MQLARSENPPGSDPGEVIIDRKKRDLYRGFIDLLLGLHDDIKLEKTRVDVRIYFESMLLCRIVPYRELFHVQVGDENTWEIRIRDEEGFLDTLDRILLRFLKIYASRSRGATHPHLGKYHVFR